MIKEDFRIVSMPNNIEPEYCEHLENSLSEVAKRGYLISVTNDRRPSKFNCMKHLVCLLFILLVHGFGYAQQTSYAYEYDQQEEEELDIASFEDPYLEMMLSLPLNINDNPFEQASRYGFSAVRYSRRGYDYVFSKYNISGIELNDAIAGGAYWDLLRSLSDYRDASVESFGQSNRSSGLLSFSSRTNYDLSAEPITSYKRVGLIASNRLYSYGASIKAADINEKTGFYYTATASVRGGDDAQIDGVYRNDLRANLLLGRRWGDRENNEHVHELGAYVSVSPIEQGMRGAATAESFELTGNNLYNPYWGYDEDGEQLSSRIKNNLVGIAGAQYKFTPTNQLLVELDVASISGTTSTSRIGWNGVANPYPDYYTYMPSYFDNSYTSSIVEAAWRDLDPDFTQISWTRLYAANRGDGISSACYYIESDVREIENRQAALSFIYALGNGVQIKGGANINLSNSRYYKTLEDDMGGLFIYDTDPFVDVSYDEPNLNSNNSYDVGRVVEVGDSFGYNYAIRNNKYKGWFAARLDQYNYSISAELSVANSSFVREGYYDKAIYNSSVTMGESKSFVFDDYNFIAAGRLRLSSSSRLEAQIVIGAQPPSVSDMFFDVRYSEMTPYDVSSTEYKSFELVYRYDNQNSIDLYAAIYATATRSESDIYRYYDDLNSRYVHAAYCDIAKNYMGAELSAEYSIDYNLSLLGAVAWARNTYASDMTAEIQEFLSGDIVSTGTVSRVEGLRVDDSPQFVSRLELKYRGMNMFNVSLGASFMADNYISISPVQRNDVSIAATSSPENQAELMWQEEFPAALTLDLSLSKTFELGNHNYLSFFLTVSNLLDKRDIIYSGYEQNRLYSVGDDVNSSWAAPDSKYYYGYGRTMYMSINFKF